jgi:hypothetical protein
MSTSILETGGRYPPGTVLAGRYRTVALIGKGSMGEVYLADDQLLGESVALVNRLRGLSVFRPPTRHTCPGKSN